MVLKKNEAEKEQKREERYQLITQIQELRAKGVKFKAIAESLGISSEMVYRFKSGNSACLSQRSSRKTGSFLDPYKNEITEMLKQGISAKRISEDLSNKGIKVPPRTMRDYCAKLKKSYADLDSKVGRVKYANSAKIEPYIEIIKENIRAGKPLCELFSILKNMGYNGSYSLLCSLTTRYRYGNDQPCKTHLVKRYDLIKYIWSDEPMENTDLIFIQNNWPKVKELKQTIQVFRQVYTDKNVEGLLSWINSNEKSGFDSINRFVRGLKHDWPSVENALKYEYNNGMLEGFVNKLKAVKRSMYGRANYDLVRAKMLLSNH